MNSYSNEINEINECANCRYFVDKSYRDGNCTRFNRLIEVDRDHYCAKFQSKRDALIDREFEREYDRYHELQFELESLADLEIEESFLIAKCKKRNKKAIDC